MSRSEGRTGEYERDERARDLHVDRYVSESDRIGSAVLPAPLEFERGRPGLRSLFESRERESESATVSPPDNLGCLPERMTRLAHSASPSAWSTTPRLRILDMAHGILSLTPPCIARAHGTHPGSRRQHVRGVSSTRAPTGSRAVSAARMGNSPSRDGSPRHAGPGPRGTPTRLRYDVSTGVATDDAPSIAPDQTPASSIDPFHAN